MALKPTAKVARIHHPWWNWECYPAGFYNTTPPRPDMTDDDCRATYRNLLADEALFARHARAVTQEWRNSSEHYLTNERMNRIAWIGQAALCHAHGIPARYRGGYMLLSPDQRHAADLIALDALNAWLAQYGHAPTTLTGAGVKPANTKETA